ncbi:dihydrodipicolinate synthase family protein [Pseudarthrobacter oxydans]|uniref:dihydrodipicolinate synthase family protein n=1 Tax=Pseudarthrobacter TaxID=1742993 RepID=UPI0015723F0B|nr:dihydrodipicolinate synthase family protein [Pseudarthrobacter sp. NCCP-2145]MDV2980198.1 dihydrodipicolinate synthase family protein [Actinomycetes bacterium ARC8]NSX35229.1 dihydrodipicolinate synthase family protein [Pseudarthrobacter oxydans]BFE44260.1 dihydrodipicolinate synthase family protein [Pseudarthrobacter oxydans]GKV71100.1 dihydrodipicolinate synthase family protein [Pseudarthrobacter sp. NCCP-2145]
MSTQFQGVIPPVVTPRHADGSIDTASLTNVTKHLLDGGVAGLFVLGSSAEVPYMTNAERGLVVSTIAEANASAGADAVPLIVGANEQTTNRVIEEAKKVIDLGADAIVVTSMYYAIGNASETETHFRAVRAAVDKPIFAYDVPVRTHFKLPTDLLVRLGRDGVIAGVKDSSGDDVSFRQLVLAAKDIPNFDIFTGHEVVVDGALLGGAQGVVPGLGNVDPRGYRNLFDAAQAGDWAKAASEQDRLADLFEIVYTPNGRVSGGAAGLGAFKTALQLMGIIESNTMSVPMPSLNETETTAIKVILERNGLL